MTHSQKTEADIRQCGGTNVSKAILELPQVFLSATVSKGRVERIGCPAGFRTEAAATMIVLRRRPHRHKSAGFAAGAPRWRLAARTGM
jgi:hypothetical protein